MTAESQISADRFTPKQLRFMDFVEQTYYITGQLPSAERSTAAVAGLSKADYEAYTKNEKMLAHLKISRGIDISEAANSEALTAEQLVVANTLLDLSDRRSERNKLKDLKISTTKYEAWKRDPAFQTYMRTRAENALGEHLPDVHMALIDTARRGDISGIKLFYEITGRHSSKPATEVNIEFLMMKVIEAIQRHVKDPEVIMNIADELGALSPSMPQANTMRPLERPRVIEHVPAVQQVENPSEKKVFEL